MKSNNGLAFTYTNAKLNCPEDSVCMIFVLNDVVEIAINNRLTGLRCKKNDVLFINQKCQLITISDKSQCRLHAVVINNELLLSRLMTCHLHRIEHYEQFKKCLSSSTFLLILSKYVNIYADKSKLIIYSEENNLIAFDGDSQMKLLNQYVEYILDMINCLNRIKAVKLNTKLDLLSKLLTVVEYMNTNINKKIQVSELARIALLSDFHFYRLFKEAFLYSPALYLRIQRAKLALSIMNTKNDRLSTIAKETGFISKYAMLRIFKKHSMLLLVVIFCIYSNLKFFIFV